jgi:hypothetical protein
MSVVVPGEYGSGPPILPVSYPHIIKPETSASLISNYF